jgi:uncharacterized protein (TIGR02118 family)
MIKVICASVKHPTNRSLADFNRYWSEYHAPLVAKTPEIKRYTVLQNLPEASESGLPAPTHDGASIAWYEDYDALRNSPASPKLSQVIDKDADAALYEWYVASGRYGDASLITLREAIQADEEQLFDRSHEWPMADRWATTVGSERTIVEGEVNQEMVKAIWVFSRKPGLPVADFQDHWSTTHAQLNSVWVDLRKYVQNHPALEAYGFFPMTHDGFSEVWYDDLASLHRSYDLRTRNGDGQTLFALPMAIVVGPETVFKG